jgi:hypothetical protein
MFIVDLLNKKLKERVKLLEYENELLAAQLNEIKAQLNITTPIRPFPIVIYEDGWDISYDTLRKKYRT